MALHWSGNVGLHRWTVMVSPTVDRRAGGVTMPRALGHCGHLKMKINFNLLIVLHFHFSINSLESLDYRLT